METKLPSGHTSKSRPCDKCGKVITVYFTKKNWPYSKDSIQSHPDDYKGQALTAVIFTMNTLTGCAHEEDVKSIYQGLFRTVKGFEAERAR